jgi:AcrR family transcriptional regulator
MLTARAKRADGEKPAYHHGDLRAALIRAALELIDRHGVKGFSLKDAAVMAGVSTAAPYRHFADKEALIGAIQMEGFALFNSALAAAYESGQTPRARIEELGIAYVLFALQHPGHFRVMFGLAGSGSPEPEADPTGFLLLVKGVAELTPGTGDEERHAMVLACWSLVHGFAMLQMEGAFAGLIAAEEVETQLRRTLTLSIGRMTGACS